MSHGDPSEQVLAHYGTKGMKWGQRKSDPGGNRLRRIGKKSVPLPTSTDKARSETYKAKVTKKGSTHALSNAELQDLVKRMNLEQQYSRLSQGQASVGKRMVAYILKNSGDVTTNVVKQHGARKLTERLASK